MERPKIGIYILIVLLATIVIGGYVSLQTVLGNINKIGDLAGNTFDKVEELLNPTPTILPDPVTIIHEIRSLARLETMQYSMEKIITAEQGQGAFAFLIGDKLLFVAHGLVIAGIDMEKIQPNDLWVEDGVLYVQLPPAEIFIATLNNELSYVYDRETGVFTKGNIDLETLARQAAEQEILKSAIINGILLQAKVNAENYLWGLFNALGYPEIIFVNNFDTNSP